MRLFQFKVLLSLLLSFQAYSFSTIDCMNKNFSAKIEDSGVILGKLKSQVIIDKKECDVEVRYTKLKFLEKAWMIDICREPVHIKYEKWKKVEVLKRKTTCSAGNKSEYCEVYFALKNLIEDKGLIYAEGRKENLQSAHGQMSCLYNLVQDYLSNGQVFAVGSSQLYDEKPVTNLKASEVKVPVQTESNVEVLEAVKEEPKADSEVSDGMSF